MKIYFDETQKERGKINTNYSILRDNLRDQGFEVEAYNDYPISEKNLKCDIFVFGCPDGSKLTKNEIKSLVNFVERGGGLLAISNAGGDRGLRTNLNNLLNKFGIEMISDQVKDETNNEFNMPTHPIIRNIKDHPITKGVAEMVIVAGCSVRGSAQMKGLALTSPVAEPPNTPVAVAGTIKGGRVVAVGSYRLFSNYGAGLSLRDNRTFALNVFKWLARQEIRGEPASKISPTKKTATLQRGIQQTAKSQPVTKPPTTTSTQQTKQPVKTSSSQPTRAKTPTAQTSQKSSIKTSGDFDQEIAHLRAEMAEMRDIIARLYSDSLGYLQEMKEEVRAMLDYIRSKEG
ncbi:MAG: hypothetical protein U9O98_09250 [Asgard group archaeon]|nr:hypothetical protein [Asgard group archaeon]